MPCDTRLKPRQTIQQRADEVRKAVRNFHRVSPPAGSSRRSDRKVRSLSSASMAPTATV